MPATSTSVVGPSELMKRRVRAAARGLAMWGAAAGGRKAAAGRARQMSASVVRVACMMIKSLEVVG